MQAAVYIFLPECVMYRVATCSLNFPPALTPLWARDIITIFVKVCGTGATHYLVIDSAASVCLSF